MVINFQRAAGGAIVAIIALLNGLMRVGRKVYNRVMPNGYSIRYQGSIYVRI